MRPLITLAAALSCASPAAHAAFVTYNSSPAFLAAAGTVATEGFDAITVDRSLRTAPVDVGPSTVAQAGSLQNESFNFIDALPVQSSLNGFGSNALIAGLQGGETLTFTFDSPIFAFGLDLFGQNNDSRQRSRFVIGSATFDAPTSFGNVLSFFGVRSDTAFSAVSIVALPETEILSLDNVRYSSNAVAEFPCPERCR